MKMERIDIKTALFTENLIDLCPHITIDGMRVEQTYSCEYLESMSIWCRECNKVFGVVIHVN